VNESCHAWQRMLHAVQRRKGRVFVCVGGGRWEGFGSVLDSLPFQLVAFLNPSFKCTLSSEPTWNLLIFSKDLHA